MFIQNRFNFSIEIMVASEINPSLGFNSGLIFQYVDNPKQQKL